ncbi:hypothetical protein ANCDUO_12349 [Ancylostoma duodenale]|uniref:FERM central domain-containing protein n=1 Tax=Ancylostoma duodenale TaxID=51022 RepID=A0A0C2G934_9BILA|nr:hypothetical protein ANCDUO_12349 [Ancylostoma duodenale]
MAALALKVDKGDNPGGYFRAEQYFPIWVIDLRGLEYVRKYMPAASEDLKDMSRMDAMMKFAFEASRSVLQSPFALNCHLYGLRRHKMDTVDNAVLGINAKDRNVRHWRGRRTNSTSSASMESSHSTLVRSQETHHQCLGCVTTFQVFFFSDKILIPDCDSLLHDSLSSSGDRGQGSVSSKQRVRIKLDSNLDLKIEKMELEHIRQERAASQSSKTSDASEQTERKLPSTTESDPSDIHDHVTHPVVDVTNVLSVFILHFTALHLSRPSSVDSASQTIETGTRCAPVDVNFNLKAGITPSDLVILEAYGIPYQGELQYSSSGGSRSDSVQHSNEMLPESMIHSYHHEQGCARSEDADSTLRSCLPQQSSISLHDLRTAGIKPPPGYIDERADNEANMIAAPALRWCAPDHQMQRLSASGQARSEPKIDSDVSAFILGFITLHFSRPSSVDSASQTIETGTRCAPVDVNFNLKAGITPSDLVILEAYGIPYQGELQYSSSGGSRSDSVQHSNEMLPESMIHSYHHEQLWGHPSVAVALLDSQVTANGGRLFTKKSSNGVINRVHSMPAHYHVINGYRSVRGRQNQILGDPNVVQSIAMGPLAAEAAGGQPAFPPASATHDYFIDEVCALNQRC